MTGRTPAKKRPRYVDPFASKPQKDTQASEAKTALQQLGLFASQDPHKAIRVLGFDRWLHCLSLGAVRDGHLLRDLMNHIPVSFPGRHKLISDIVSNSCFIVPSNFYEILACVDSKISHIQSGAGTIPTQLQEMLWDASLKLKRPLLTFVMPKVTTCIRGTCRGQLYSHVDMVTAVTVHTLNGPLPGLKAAKRCRLVLVKLFPCLSSIYFCHK